jgi:pilus assembly protein Flp/PilA
MAKPAVAIGRGLAHNRAPSVEASEVAYFGKLLRDSKSVTAVEYALIASLISVAALGAYKGLGTKVQSQFQDVDSNLAAHM